jgi:hypothetical protein
MLHELHHEGHDEAQLKYLSHNIAVNERTARLKAANPHFAAGVVSQAARFPSLDAIGAGDSSIPSRGFLNTMKDKLWEVSSHHSHTRHTTLSYRIVSYRTVLGCTGYVSHARRQMYFERLA